MKIILSRKGFDSTWGGVPSPIFKSNELFSLPIPLKGRHFYRELNCCGANAGNLVEDLAGKGKDGRKINRNSQLHLDPDLRSDAIPRKEGWLPCFGQCRGPQTHLENHAVGKGDLFLFFGSFKEVDLAGGKWEYKDTPTIHAIFGWLQIGQIFRQPSVDNVPPWLKYHDHCLTELVDSNWKNAIYIAPSRLTLESTATHLAGGGVFSDFHPVRQLTDPECTWRKGRWRLPAWFYPFPNKTPLSHHKNKNRWTKDRSCTFLDTACIGQEFVLNADEYPETKKWIRDIMGLNK